LGHGAAAPIDSNQLSGARRYLHKAVEVPPLKPV